MVIVLTLLNKTDYGPAQVSVRGGILHLGGWGNCNFQRNCCNLTVIQEKAVTLTRICHASRVCVAITFKIFKIARKHQRQIHEQIQTTPVLNDSVDTLKCKKSAFTVLCIYGLLLILYLPFLAVMVVETISGVTRSVKVAYDLTTAVVFINSSVNPIIYCWRMKQVRRAVKHYLKNLMFHDQN